MTTKTIVPFPVDLVIFHRRNSALPVLFADRLRGTSIYLDSSAATAEPTTVAIASNFNSNTVDGIDVDGSTGGTWVSWNFKRAPGFMDVVCYTGTGVAGKTVNHNLTVAPELIITKRRDAVSNSGWVVGCIYYKVSSDFDRIGFLNLTNGFTGGGAGASYNNVGTTSYTLSTTLDLNASNGTYIAYLFATLAGISKVGSYTGNGTTQTINCGFTGGARFVLIKRTDSTGGWYVFDTARGMTTLTDPYLFLNSTAAEVATLGAVTSVTTGFAVNAAIVAAINTNAASYIFLAIA